jgi:hypothetical protein
MSARILAIALLASACGEVAGRPTVDAATSPSDGAAVPDAAMALAYKGAMAESPVAAYGGPPSTFCNYTMTLRQLEIELGILATGQVISGRFQDLAIEGKDAACTLGVIPPKIASYTLQSAVPSGAITKLTFLGAATNEPRTSLVGNLTRSGAGYSAALTVQRTDQIPVLTWTINVTLSLSQ